MYTKRALIFANGERVNLDALQGFARPGDYCVAADGGLRFLRALGLSPDLVIGDLDSLSPEEIDRLRASGVNVRQYSVHKNETDLELALEAVIEAGYSRIRILAALGGRLDMTLGNIFLLMLPSLAECDVRLEDGFDEVFLIRPGEPGVMITGRAGERVSLLPLNGPAEGVRTRGLQYPLRSETLYPERTRGISNVMEGEEAAVSLESGLLLCIHTHQSPRKNLFGEESSV